LRSKRNRKRPDVGLLTAETADGSPTPQSKKTRQTENKVQDNGLSPEKHLEISVGPTDTALSSVRTRGRVRFDISDNPDMPGPQVRRRKQGVVGGEVELLSSPPRTRKRLRSKVNVEVGSVVKEDLNDPSVSSPPVRKTRGTKLTSAVDVASSPRRKRGADAESSPVPSKRRPGVTAKSDTYSRRRRRAVAVTADKPLPPRRQGRAVVSTETDIPESAVTKRTRGKSAVKNLRPIATAVSEDSEASPLTAGKRQKQGSKAVEQPASRPARKLRGTKLPGEFCAVCKCIGLEHNEDMIHFLLMLNLLMF
jgi:hypothetical protein